MKKRRDELKKKPSKGVISVHSEGGGKIKCRITNLKMKLYGMITI